ncbi:diguanylate cyclase [Aquipseudomonas alcaligenes]|uniref:Sensor domain-containing diguanylate cyclase n=1 Tax=Aquipseudomonas alcaligenes TaxID=43263 RepID=A0AA37CJF1_AQUAC|nr:diguanylate cyclase [Pseudomonas alcaligenes]BCR23247.1 sensor domain-containing diguanylate cyclase [Pseudomonas alcaligenes]GIZ67666.1 sensor domain-containing diguanylate cyclase [Pseudomonas alcaligenes]GIZ71973.1 sensor domain-containing diguanylate cyclase [Pseudomonas alcaligenes]GIZ76322.1 sensor domain-containing diguanylate cyclase [Pseudomonas alcaligenes]GIZ80396.1 sensor domain-containing diguanylate cyclase [Pseudomonas alcaligenes]
MVCFPVLRALLALLCISLAAGQLRAAPVELRSDASGQSLNGQIELLEDVGGTLSIADMADPAIQQRFTPANGRASVGQNPNPWWIKLQLQRGAEAPARWWLEIGAVTQLDLQLYSPDGQGGWIQRQSGERVSFAEGRDHPYRRMVLELPELGTTSTTFYLRSFDPAGNSFPLRVWQLEDLDHQAISENLGLGLIYGIIAALLLYNLFIFFTLRDNAYFWYVLTTAGALLMIVSMSGHGFQYLWPEGPVPFWLDRVTLPSLWGFCACRFTQTLLQTRQHVRWAHHLLSFACVCYVIAVTLEGLGQRNLAAWLIALLSLTSIPAALGSALVRWRQGYFPALLYLCGYGLILGSISLALMRSTGLVQPATWNAYVFPLAVAAESILFSFALAYRIQMLKQEKAEALRQADREKGARLAQMQASADDLQEAVRLRTAELAQANQQLCEREQRLQHAAFHDPLTELPNRRYLIERAEVALADAQRRGESVALMLVDLDHFKPINDRYGHDAGDLMLRTIGHRLREHVRTHDMVARLGGDEFAVLVCGPDAQQHTQEIANRLLAELSRPVLYGANRLAVTISIGAAFYPQHALQFAGLYKAADEAMYRAKQKGRSGFVLQGCDGELSPQTCLILDVLKVPSGLG